MAEGFGKKILHKFNVESAGTMPEKINPNAIKAMKNVAIDISNYKSKKIEYSELAKFDYVITLCGDAKDRCPVINANRHIHWNIPDPAKFNGNSNEIESQFSKVRDLIYSKIRELKI
tara:strand:+ start:830 stop:1180 length:351 start_codon:yes stop_codon:yes gene_type:complete